MKTQSRGKRPDLWKVIVAGAAVTDIARFHTAHGGQHWIAGYGSPENPDDLEFLIKYSPYHPYHTLPEKIEAPAILTIAPDNDDPRQSWHSYKMHAAWLAANISKIHSPAPRRTSRPSRQPRGEQNDR